MIPQLKGFYQDADPVRVTAPADVEVGDVLVVQNRVGVVVKTVDSGEDTLMIVGTDVHGIEMPKSTGACTRHAKAYWEVAGDPIGGVADSGAVTATASTNLLIGRFAESAASGDATCVVELTNA